MDAFAAQGAKPCREVGAEEARRAGRLGGKFLEAGLGGRVAVDADQRPGRPDRRGDPSRVAAAAEGAVDGDLARLGREQLGQLGGEDGLGARSA